MAVEYYVVKLNLVSPEVHLQPSKIFKKLMGETHDINQTFTILIFKYLVINWFLSHLRPYEVCWIQDMEEKGVSSQKEVASCSGNPAFLKTCHV